MEKIHTWQDSVDEARAVGEAYREEQRKAAEQEEMCFIGKCRGCGAIRFATVDKPEYAAENAKEVARCIKAGLVIRTVTAEEVRSGNWKCTCAK